VLSTQIGGALGILEFSIVSSFLLSSKKAAVIVQMDEYQTEI
jgi:hypothetical protein